MSDETWRILIVIELTAMMFCAGYLHYGYRRAMPRILWRLGFAYGAVFMAAAVAVTVNLAASEPLPLGTRLFAAALVPVSGFVVTLTTVALVRRGQGRSD